MSLEGAAAIRSAIPEIAKAKVKTKAEVLATKAITEVVETNPRNFVLTPNPDPIDLI